MKNIIRFCFLILMGCLLSSRTYAQYPFQNSDLPLEERVEDLISRLSLEEKASLMVHNTKGIPRLDIPAYDWWNECLHGVARAGRATVFPQAIGLAATFDDSLIFRVSSAISDEARAKFNEAQRIGNRSWYNGLTFWTPNINLFRDPRWGRGQETYGEDPFLTSQIGKSFVKGLQGDDPHYLKAAACAKHFVVHSGPEALRHKFNAISSESDLRNTYLPAFKELVDAGVAGVMCAYNRTNNEPCCGSNTLLKELLREEWNFKGYVVSDCWALKDIWHDHKTVDTDVEAAALSLKNTVNINCGVTYNKIPEAVEKGLVSEKQVDEALAGALRILFRLGWFDPTDQVPFSQIGPEKVASPEHRALSREVAAKSIVLLKNKDSVLPLSKDAKNYFVTGPNAGNIQALWGNYSGFSENMVSVLEGVVGKVSAGTVVNYNEGCQVSRDTIFRGTWYAGMSDATIAVIGLNSLLEGEQGDAYMSLYGGDKKDLQLPANQVKFIKTLKKSNKPLIVVILGGSALSLKEIEPYADAILWAWYPGQEGGNAIADILFGDVNPAGRLPVTFYKSVEDLPPFEDYSMENRTYRYFKGEALYPFGFGLSYTSFEYSGLQTDKDKYKRHDSLNLSFSIKNKGESSGEEVAQIYYRKKGSDELRPIKSLIEFKRTLIPAHKDQKMEFQIPISRFTWYNVKRGKYLVEPGSYEILIGTSSEDIRLRKTITIK